MTNTMKHTCHVSHRRVDDITARGPAENVCGKIQLGPLIELELPIFSLRWRRVTFIEMNWF